MKKFFVMILLVSTFFIGLGSLIDRAGANMKSDARALEIIKQARVAIGGEANINNVRGLTIVGDSTHFFEREGSQQTDQGSLEINLQLPNQFSKMVKTGNADNGGAQIRKQVEVIVTKDENGNLLSEDIRGGDKKIVIREKSDGDSTLVDENGKQTVFIKRKDGTAQGINSGAKTVLLKKDGDTQTFKMEDGNVFVFNKDVKTENMSGNRNNEMLRTTLALLLTAPEGVDVSYTFAGEGNVDGNSCNIVEAQTGGSSFKLFLDKSTFLPKMISFMGMDLPKIIKLDKPVADSSQKQVRVMVKTSKDMATTEHQLKFSDFRSVGGLLLPFTWTETVGGKQSQNINITNYEVNPINIADKFKNQKVFMRTVKPQ